MTDIRRVTTETMRLGDPSKFSRWGTSTRLNPQIEIVVDSGVARSCNFTMGETDGTQSVIVTSTEPAAYEAIAKLLLEAAQRLRELGR